MHTLLKIALLTLLLAGTARCQTVLPPIAEYRSTKVTDTWTIRNESKALPLLVVGSEVRTWTDDASGQPRFEKVDPKKIRVKLSENSARIPPSRSHNFTADVECLQKQPCWVSIFTSLTLPRNKGQVGVIEVLPHVVYLESKKPIQRGEIQTAFLNDHSLEIRNTGARFDRPLVTLWTAGGKKTVSFPLFPDYRRVVTDNSAIVKATLHFAKFKINTAR